MSIKIVYSDDGMVKASREPHTETRDRVGRRGKEAMIKYAQGTGVGVVIRLTFKD